nr:hypothetical protein [uncultured Flavobacterium sp.]
MDELTGLKSSPKKGSSRWLFYKRNSSVGTIYIVATDFNPLMNM